MSTLVPESSGNGTLVGVIGKSTLCCEDGISRIFLRVRRPSRDRSQRNRPSGRLERHRVITLAATYLVATGAGEKAKGRRVRGFGRVVSSRR